MKSKNKKQKKATPALTSVLNVKFCPKSKRSQEEMIGFALIIIIVAVILLIFLGFSLRGQQKEIVESYEVENFIQTFLQYTTDCRDNLEYLSIRKLIFDCSNEEICLDGRNTCDVLTLTLTEIMEESWKVGDGWPYKGYELNITSNEEEMLLLKEGEITKNSKGSMQDFVRFGSSIEIYFTAYY